MKINKLALIALLALVGCAKTSEVESLAKQLDELKTRNQEVESRLARVEKDLYKFEVKKAPQQESVACEFKPAQNVASNVVDLKIRTFLKEYTGYTLGDPAPRFSSYKERLNLKPLKKFQYFDNFEFDEYAGQIYSISLFCIIEKKYSYESSRMRIKQTLSDMAVSLGLASDYFESRREKQERCKTDQERRELSRRMETEVKPSLTVRTFGVDSRFGLIYGHKFEISFIDFKLKAEMQRKGESLPEAK